MQRRRVLTTIVSTAVVLAGCSAPSSEPSENQTDDNSTDDESEEFVASFEDGTLSVTWTYDGVHWLGVDELSEGEAIGSMFEQVSNIYEWSQQFEPDADATALTLRLLENEETIKSDGEYVGVVAETTISL